VRKRPSFPLTSSYFFFSPLFLPLLERICSRQKVFLLFRKREKSAFKNKPKMEKIRVETSKKTNLSIFPLIFLCFQTPLRRFLSFHGGGGRGEGGGGGGTIGRQRVRSDRHLNAAEADGVGGGDGQGGDVVSPSGVRSPVSLLKALGANRLRRGRQDAAGGSGQGRNDGHVLDLELPDPQTLLLASPPPPKPDKDSAAGEDMKVTEASAVEGQQEEADM
jgi:hypothetical protein